MATTEDQQIADLTQRLRTHYTAIAAEQVDNVVDRHRAVFQAARIRDFVPLLIERAVRKELTDATGQHVAAEELVTVVD